MIDLVDKYSPKPISRESPSPLHNSQAVKTLRFLNIINP